MSPEQAVELGRRTLEAAFWISAPVLIVATVVSLAISIVQTLTSIQEATVSTVPRLAAAAIAAFLALPWILGQLMQFTLKLFSDFGAYVR